MIGSKLKLVLKPSKAWNVLKLTNKVIDGLIQLSGTALEAYGEIKKDQEEQRRTRVC